MARVRSSESRAASAPHDLTCIDTPLTHVALRLSLQRTLLGVVNAELHAALIQADPIRKALHLRFEYAAEPSGPVGLRGKRTRSGSLTVLVRCDAQRFPSEA
jgi:hypothetical protein